MPSCKTTEPKDNNYWEVTFGFYSTIFEVLIDIAVSVFWRKRRMNLAVKNIMVLPHYPRKIKYLQNNPKKDKFLYNQSKNLCRTILQNMTED